MAERVKIISKTACPGDFSHVRLQAPEAATQAQPGHKIIWGERELPVMRSDGDAGWIELLVKGKVPKSNEITGPQGDALTISESCERSLLIGNLTNLPSLIFLADKLRHRKDHKALLLFQADDELPFRPAPCRTIIPSFPHGVIATLPLLNDWGITVRIASHDDLPGCYDGEVEALAQLWLDAQERVGDIEVVRAE